MNRKKKTRLTTNDKIRIFMFVIAFLIFVYIIKLASLQIFDIYNFKNKGDKVSKYEQIVSPDRGEIFDSKGRALAITQKSENVYMLRTIRSQDKTNAENYIKNEEEFSKLDEKQQAQVRIDADLIEITDEQIDNLAKALDINKRIIVKMVDEKSEGYLLKSISAGIKKRLMAYDFPFIQILTSNERYYPNKEMLAKTIGFIDQDGSGYGLEKYYDEVLSGSKGYREFYKALRGTSLPYETDKYVEPKKSNNLVTTIDEDMQKIVYDALNRTFIRETPKNATAILMDPNTGGVLAMDSLPTFDPNNPRNMNSEIDKLFLSKIKGRDVEEYMLSRWMNEGVSMIYEPGSVFKSITTAIALESKPELENKKFHCEGHIEIAPGVTIKCISYDNPFGEQSMKEAFSNSCNTSYVKMIREINREDFVNYGSSLRFGVKTNIDLPMEYEGIFPVDTDIDDVDFAPMSYGHSLSVTPIQMLSALNATVNGGIYYRPHIVSKLVDDKMNTVFEFKNNKLNQVLSEETSKKMREMYQNNAREMHAFENSKLKLGAKTGTAVKVESVNPLKTKDNNVETNVVSVFVSYPIDAPKYTLLVVIDEALVDPKSTTTAAKLALEIFEGIAKLENSTNVIKEKKSELVRVPNLIGKTLGESKQILEELGINFELENSSMAQFHIIDKQFPEKDNLVNKNTVIKLGQTKGKEMIRVPKVVGLSVEKAKEILQLNHIKFEVEGNGETITEQSVMFENVKASTVIKLTAKEKE